MFVDHVDDQLGLNVAWWTKKARQSAVSSNAGSTPRRSSCRPHSVWGVIKAISLCIDLCSTFVRLLF